MGFLLKTIDRCDTLALPPVWRMLKAKLERFRSSYEPAVMIIQLVCSSIGLICCFYRILENLNVLFFCHVSKIFSIHVASIVQ